MQKPIKIGVTHTGTAEKHSNYVKWLKGNEDVEIIALSPADTNLEDIKFFDGIVLSGGIDMHPKYYHSSVTDYPHAPSPFHELRDEFEVAIFLLTRQNQLPLLGVCRGMQLVNCMLGGTLTQDNGLQANAIHRYEQNDKAHGINIFPGTLLNEITVSERLVVNSAHHQSINMVAKELQVNCLSDDGIIEGLEWIDKTHQPFFLGIQWHPERMFKFQLGESAAAKNIRDRFIAEIKKSMDSSCK